MLALVCRYVGNRGEDVACVGSGTLDAVPVINAALACLGVHVEMLQVVVEIDRTGTEVTAQQCRVRSEYGRDIDLSLFGKRQRDAGQPFVKMRDDRSLFLVGHKLGTHVSM